MGLKEYVGSISLEVDGVEVEVATVSPKTSTGRRPVKTMNRLRNIAGFSRGIKTYDLRVTAVIPIEGSPLDWDNIEGAKLTIDPGDGGQRVSYLDCFSTDVGEEYQAEGEARRDISLVAVRKVNE
jgi:hypothetical protein